MTAATVDLAPALPSWALAHAAPIGLVWGTREPTLAPLIVVAVAWVALKLGQRPRSRRRPRMRLERVPLRGR